jgi:hypothetical protein
LIQPPELICLHEFSGWTEYIDSVYTTYLNTVALAGLSFCGWPVKVRFIPQTKNKGYGFWHLISEAPDPRNRNEDERIPDLRRCERIRWVAWCIQHADACSPGFSWWENERRGETHAVLWAEHYDFTVVLAKRQPVQRPGFYLLKTAYCLTERSVEKFKRERNAWMEAQTD